MAIRVSTRRSGRSLWTSWSWGPTAVTSGDGPSRPTARLGGGAARAKGFAFEPLSEFVADMLGCRVGIQRYDGGQSLGVSELFRLNWGGWRLVRRHADWLQPKGAAVVVR